MIDRAFIGKVLPSTRVEVEKGQLRLFAKATGERNPIYHDEAAARAAGHRALPAPPTFAFSLDLLGPTQDTLLDELGVELGHVLHAEQSFEYFAPIYAGDVMTCATRVADIYDKKGGGTGIHRDGKERIQSGRRTVRPRPDRDRRPATGFGAVSMPEFDSVAVGDRLPEHICGPISRATLALFAGGSGDHNALHVDIDAARAFGMPDVFAQGMLSMAYLAQMLTRWVPQQRLVSWNVRFRAITPVHATVICTGVVTEKFMADGDRRVRVALQADLRDGPVTLQGEAVISLV